MIPISDSVKTKRFPIINWLLIGLNLLVFMFELSLDEKQAEILFHLYGLVPSRYSSPEWAHYAGYETSNHWPFITNMFLHGGWGHFLGNMWTLYLFGDNVEDRLGPLRYILFYIVCGLAASITHYVINIDSMVPAIGASGAISGVMAAYMKFFPKAQLTLFIPILFIPFLIEVSAYFYLSIWFAGQLFNGTFSYMLGHVSGIAFWAHIGGFVVGFILALLLRRNTNQNYRYY